MIFDWLFGKHSVDPSVQGAWNLVKAKRVLLDAEDCIARALADFTFKTEFLKQVPAITDEQLKRQLRKWFYVQKRSLAEENFEEKTLNDAIHLMISAVDKYKLDELNTRLQNWHDNLTAQHTWLNSHPDMQDIRKDLSVLQKLVEEEGKILFDVNVKLPNMAKEVNIKLAMAEYPSANRLQYRLFKAFLGRKERKWIVFYNAYSAKKYPINPLLKGALLDPIEGKAGFFMAETPEKAIEAAAMFGAADPRNFSVMRVTMQQSCANRFVEKYASVDYYFIIPVDKYNEANECIKKKQITFEPLKNVFR